MLKCVASIWARSRARSLGYDCENLDSRAKIFLETCKVSWIGSNFLEASEVSWIESCDKSFISKRPEERIEGIFNRECIMWSGHFWGCTFIQLVKGGVADGCGINPWMFSFQRFYHVKVICQISLSLSLSYLYVFD